MIRAIALVVIAATALTGCRDASESDSGPLVRDSAGIRIVQNKAPAWSATQAWRIGDARLTIGESESPEQALHLVAGAVRLGDGTIAIANGGSNEIRRYGSDGEYLGAIGRTGEGPGEFRALGWLGRSERNSLIAWDRRLNRLTIVTPSGQHSRSYVPSLPEASAGPAVHGLLWRGRVVLSRGASFAPADGTSGLQRQPLHAWLVSSSGQLEAEHGPFEGEAVDLLGVETVSVLSLQRNL